MNKPNIRLLSLFANIGIGETYLHESGIKTVVANELLADRVNVYKSLYPEVNTVLGDITNKSVFDEIIAKSLEHKVNAMIATPPCQGMSIAGKMLENDPRNSLIIKVFEIFSILKPDYLLIENVPQMLKTNIIFKGNVVNIKDFIQTQAGDNYNVVCDVLDCADYGTPQHRKRTFVRIFKKGLTWQDPVKQKKITVRQAIEYLPSLNPGERSDIPWHYAKTHNSKQVYWMEHTPTGKTALQNPPPFQPNKDGRPIKGFSTTYKRIEWDKPSPTITMANGSISSQNNVHPGRDLGNGKFSDPRVLTLLELFILMGLPKDWKISPDISENKIRHYIGEAVPPIMMKNLWSGIGKVV